jgi:dipeptidyl aminopeptidase/acylaminoacyl peptidase
MHDDLIDAVSHVIEAGYTDPRRVAIFGASYGGYAALVGAAFTPEVFAAAVSLCGPSNLETLIRSVPEYWKPMLAQLHARVGNPDTEPEFLRSRSPLSRAGDIAIPLLIGQGGNDPRVMAAESDQIVKALSEKGMPPDYLFFPDEGHTLVKPANRLRFFRAAERFLAAHLAGRCATGPETE